MNPRETEDQDFDRRADAELRRLEKALSSYDPDEVDLDLSGDILTLTVQGRHSIVINRHRAARQIWMSARRQAWHFNENTQTGQWHTEKTGEELTSVLEAVLVSYLGYPVHL